MVDTAACWSCSAKARRGCSNAKAMPGGADECAPKPRLAYLQTSGTEEVLLAICFAS